MNALVPVNDRLQEIFPPGQEASIFSGLPAHIPVERVISGVRAAVIANPKLLNANPRMLVIECIKIASLGLYFDPQLGEAYLILDGNGNIQSRVGYRGLRKLVRQSGLVPDCYAEIVYEGDEFDYGLGTDRYVKHKPLFAGKRGKPIGAYAIGLASDGGREIEVMTMDQIEAIRDRSDGYRAFKRGSIKSTPWTTDFEEMARKTALRRVAKKLPQSPELMRAIEIEDRAENYIASQPAAQDRPGPAQSPLAARLAQRAPAQPVTITDHVNTEISGAPPPASESPASEDASAPSRSEEAGVGPAGTPADESPAGPLFTGADAARVKVIAEALRGAVSDEDVNEVFRVHLKPLGKEHPVVKGVSVLFSLTRDRITGDADPDQFNEELFQLVGGE